MEKHIPGRLVAREDAAICLENWRDRIDGGCLIPGGQVRGRSGGGREEILANAVRIVACWNACEGMDDPATEIKHLRESNAELLAAAEDMLYDVTPAMPGYYRIASEKIHALEAAIAKTKGA